MAMGDSRQVHLDGPVYWALFRIIILPSTRRLPVI
jgi:hypothetical protein